MRADLVPVKTMNSLKGWTMPRSRVVFCLAFLIPALAVAQEAPRVDPKEYAAADIRVMSPGVVYNAGLLDLATEYSKHSGKKVAVTLVGMGTIVKAVKTNEPPADVIMLPFELMSTLSLDGGV